MKKMKRLFALALAVIMCFMCLPFSASAEESVEYPIVYTHKFDEPNGYDGEITFYVTETTLDIYKYGYCPGLTDDILPTLSEGITRINIYGYPRYITNVFNDLRYLETVYIEDGALSVENSFNNCPKLARIEFGSNYIYEVSFKNSFNNLSKDGVAWFGHVDIFKKSEPYVVNSFGNTTFYANPIPKESVQNFKVANGKNGVTLTWDNPQGYLCMLYRGDEHDYEVASDYREDCNCSWCRGEENYYYYGWDETEPEDYALCRFEKYATKLANIYVNTYVDSNVESGTTYYYYNNLYYQSSGDDILAITYLSAPNVTVKAKGTTTVNVSWKKVKGAEGYYVYQSTTGKNGSWKRVAKLSADKLSYSATKLFPDTKYYYCVKAYKGKDVSYGYKKSVKTNALDADFTGFVSCGNDKYYAKNGELQKTLTSMVYVDGKNYYVKKGVLAKNSTGFVKYKDRKYYVKNGVSPTGKTMVKHKGIWYYIKNGKLATTSTGFVKYGKDKYYVKNGVAPTGKTIVKHNGKRYYIKNGKFAATSTGYVTYKNQKYYVKNGVVVK